MPSFETAARSLKVELIIAPIRSHGVQTAIIPLGREPGGGLVVLGGGLPVATIILAAARYNVPAVYELSEFARNGGLLSYGPDRVDRYSAVASERLAWRIGGPVTPSTIVREISARLRCRVELHGREV